MAALAPWRIAEEADVAPGPHTHTPDWPGIQRQVLRSRVWLVGKPPVPLEIAISSSARLVVTRDRLLSRRKERQGWPTGNDSFHSFGVRYFVILSVETSSSHSNATNIDSYILATCSHLDAECNITCFLLKGRLEIVYALIPQDGEEYEIFSSTQLYLKTARDMKFSHFISLAVLRFKCVNDL